MARDHRKLDAFKLADQMVLDVYRITANFPVAERYGLQAQLRRAAVSTPTNIVEGCARDGEGDYARFLDIAFGSSREVLYLLTVANRLNFLDDRRTEQLTKHGNRVAGALLSLQRSIRP
jgi:four helix bundle protein